MHPNFYFLLKFFKICHSEHGVLLGRVQGVTLFTSDSECVNRRGARSVRNSQTQKKEKWSMPSGRARCDSTLAQLISYYSARAYPFQAGPIQKPHPDEK